MREIRHFLKKVFPFIKQTSADEIYVVLTAEH